MTHAAALRSRLSGGESVLMPGVWDPLSALLAERAGFHTVFVSGFAVADATAAVEQVLATVQPGDRVLVKGSRAAGLEVVPTLLAERLEGSAP